MDPHQGKAVPLRKKEIIDTDVFICQRFAGFRTGTRPTKRIFKPSLCGGGVVQPKAGSLSEATRPSELNSHRSVMNALVFITGVRADLFEQRSRKVPRCFDPHPHCVDPPPRVEEGLRTKRDGMDPHQGKAVPLRKNSSSARKCVLMPTFCRVQNRNPAYERPSPPLRGPSPTSGGGLK